MKKMYITIMALSIAILVFADDYKILYMNTLSIMIGNSECRKNDVFSDESTISWIKERQALKAQNLQNKEIYLFTERAFKSYNSMTIKDYFFKTKRLSSRNLSLDELSDLLCDTFDLLDTIRFESPIPMDSTRNYFIQYIKNDSTIEKILPIEKDSIIICRNIFDSSDSTIEKYARLLLRSENVDEDYIITDSMRIVLIPFNLDESQKNNLEFKTMSF